MSQVTFSPNNASAPPFSTTVSIDGVNYQMSALWNSYGNRWFAQIADMSGNVLLYAPMITSPDGDEISIVSADIGIGSLYVDATTSMINTN